MSANVHETGKLKGEPAAIIALAAGASYADAAQAAGVAVRTIGRRMEGNDYRRCVTAARAGMIERASGKLADATGAAVETLVLLLLSTNAQTRLGAARSILEQAGRYRELVEISERLSRLEELLDSTEPNKIRRIR